jgi:hypothetical protein
MAKLPSFYFAPGQSFDSRPTQHLYCAHYCASGRNFDQLHASFGHPYAVLIDFLKKSANTDVCLAAGIWRSFCALSCDCEHFSTTLEPVYAFFAHFCKQPANPHYDPVWRPIGKIQYCKLAMILSCGRIIRLSRFNLIVKGPQVDPPPVKLDLGPPFIRPRVLPYAPVARRRLARIASIAVIL